MQVLGNELSPTTQLQPSRVSSEQRMVQRFRQQALKPDAFARSLPLRFGLIATRPFELTHVGGPVEDLRSQGVLVLGGGGEMGSNIAQAFAQKGFRIGVTESRFGPNGPNPEDGAAAAAKALKKISGRVAGGVKKGFTHRDDLKAFKSHQSFSFDGSVPTLERLSQSNNPARPSQNPGLIIEAVIENKDVKIQQFQHMARIFPNAVLATNTSSYSVEELASGLSPADRNRMVGIHFFKPAVKNRLVEIVKGPETSDDTIEKMRRYIRSIGKVPIVVGDKRGFVANHLLIAPIIEAARIYDEGFASTKEINEAAFELFWPHAVGSRTGRKMAPAGFEILEDYQALGYTIARNLSDLGGPMEVPNLLITEHDAVQRNKEELRKLKELLKETRDKGDRAQLKADIAEAEEDARYLPKGKLPPPESKHISYNNHNTQDKKAYIQERLRCAVYYAAVDMVQNGITTPADVDTACKVGFEWRFQPFQDMKQRGYPAVRDSLRVFTDVLQEHGLSYNRSISGLSDLGASGEALTPKWITSSYNNADKTMTITMGRSADENQLSTQMLDELTQAFRHAIDQGNVERIVFEANGGKTFCAGADLEEIQGITDREDLMDYITKGRELMQLLRGSNTPIWAKVSGPTYGGGSELVLAIASNPRSKIIMSSDAKMHFPEVNLGIVPAWHGTEFLPRLVGKPLAKALIYNGKTKYPVPGVPGPAVWMYNLRGYEFNTRGMSLDPKTAYELGLADAVANRHNLEDAFDTLLLDDDFAAQERDPRQGVNWALKDYPNHIREKYKLRDNPEKAAGRSVGVFSQQALQLAHRLIDESDSGDGNIDAADLDQIMAPARRKMEFVGTNVVDQLLNLDNADWMAIPFTGRLTQLLRLVFTGPPKDRNKRNT